MGERKENFERRVKKTVAFCVAKLLERIGFKKARGVKNRSRKTIS